MSHGWLADAAEAVFCWQMPGITAQMQFLPWPHLLELEVHNGGFR